MPSGRIFDHSTAFSSEVDTSSHEENAIKQRLRDVFRFHEIGKCSTLACAKLVGHEAERDWGLDKTRTYDNFDIISSINLLTMLS
jgi:hypothetical protein